MMAPGALQDRRWWLRPKDEQHECLMAVARDLHQKAGPWREVALRWVRMYGKYTAAGAGPTPSPTMRSDRLRYNVCAQAVDTLAAEIGMNKPKVTFLVDGDWTLRKSAEQAEMLVEAQMRENGIYGGEGRKVLRDALVIGSGLVLGYVCPETLKPKCERVFPFELLFDTTDARYGKPRTLIRERLVDRAVLRAKWPKFEKEIDAAPRFTVATDEAWMLADSGDADLILLVDAWHLPSSSKAGDGRFVTAIDGATLVSRPYKRDRFPLVKLDWNAPLAGFWGVGAVEELAADQVELNRVLRRIQDAAGVAAGVWLVPDGQKLRLDHFTDVPGACISYRGAPPTYHQPNTVPADLIEHAERIITRALRRLGISEQFAAAMKPPGLDSGEAIRSNADIYSQRQSEHAAAWETWHVEVAKMFIDLNQDVLEMLKEGQELPEVAIQVKRGRRTVLKRIRWQEMNDPVNEWVVQAFPMSMLPREPSGRVQTIQEWIGAGLIDQETARYLLDVPDTEGAIKLQTVDYDFVLYAYETMVEDGEFVPPEPYLNLEFALQLMRRAYMRGVIDGVPDERLDLVRDCMKQMEMLIRKAQPPAPPAAAMPADASAPAPDIAGLDPNTLQVAA